MSDLDERVAAARLQFHERWERVCSKLAHLKQLDSLGVRYEAREHGYRFHPCASLAEIATVEEKLGAPLPQELLFLCTTVGNGGQGPPQGLYAAQHFALWSIDDYREEVLGLQDMLEIDDEGVEREVASVTAQFAACGVAVGAVRLVCILHREYVPYASCTDWLYVICGGPKDGAVIARIAGEEHSVMEIGASVADVMEKWLDREIEIFHRAQRAIEAGAGLREIWDALSRLDLAALGQDWCYLYNGERDDMELTLPMFFRILESLLGEDLAEEGEALVDRQRNLRPEHQARFEAARERYLARCRQATPSA